MRRDALVGRAVLRGGVAHQIANPFEADLVYLAIGPFDPHEVCVYPDSGKVMVRGIKQIGRLSTAEYLEGEPNPPQIFELAKKLMSSAG